MASRNLKPSSVQGFDAGNINDKMQSSTLKRQPSPDWSKTDLLRLLSYFEGELQARDITIATLKAEKAKQLLYQAKYGRFGLGDPFVALQRDAEGKNDTGFDEAAIKSMYDNQLAQLENLIATQRKAQLKMREQLGNSEKRFHKVCSELEEEKQKHAQDTAQGDDVTYMLEKERERLKAEIDFEKNQNKKLEKDLKKTLASLEEERANAARHKQVAIMLIKERKNLIERIIAENQIRDEMESALTDGKCKIQNMAEGLAQESKKSLKMEAALDKQSSKFDSERETLRMRLQEEEKQTNILRTEVARLSKQLESLQQQVRSSTASPSGGQIRSTVSPGRTTNPLPTRNTVVAGSIPNSVGVPPQSPVVDSPPLEHLSTAVKSSDSSHPLEFLGAEMANLQKLLATMRTDEASTSNSHVIATETRTSSSSFTPTSSSSSTHGKSTTPFSLVESPSHSQPGAVREQNNNTLKLVINNQDVKTSATAQIGSPTSIPLHVYDENLTTTPTKYSTHHIVSPTSVSSAFTKSLPSPSAEFPAPVSQLSLHSNQQLTANSPSAKRRSIPSRSRSKSPTKTAHYLPRSTSSQIFNSSKPPQDSWSLFQVNTPNQAVVDSQAESLPLIYNLVCSGDVIALHKHLKTNPSDVSLALKDGSTAVHYAAECNQESCLKLLLDNRAKPNSPREDKITPLHIAASKGHSGCLRLLLSNGAVVNPVSATSQTPLHLAAKSGHFECCQLLLRHGADILFTAQDNLTAIHYAVQGNQPDILKLILDKMNFVQASDAAYQILNITDKDGWTVTHMAAYLPSPDCLLVLAESLPLDLNAKDKLGRSVKVVASPACKDAISDLERLSVPKLKVVVELRYILENTTVSNVQIGTMDVEPGYSWKMIEDQLRSTLHFYLAQLGLGLKTRRITRLDGEADRQDKEFSLGLTMANIKHFEMGYYKWTPGMQTDTAPYVMIANNNQLRKITVVVDDAGNMCELIAFDVLQPVYSINNYLRLLEQYKSVIFYGPSGSGKSYLAQRLAQSIAAQEIAMGRKPAIYQLQLEQGYSWSNFLTFLKQKNCVVPIDKGPDNVAPILVLDNLEMVDISRVFGELLDAMEYRGIKHAFYLRGDGHSESGMHYLTSQFYLIGTMNKSRSLGVDLSILPRFRWVQFRLDTEPLRGLLARHFLRRIINTYHGHLPSPEDPVLRAVEWIVCVWQRLNDSLNKLGFLEVVLGPCMFFKCPLEKQDHRLILEWMKNLWNQKIAPRVRESVKRGTGSEAPTEGQQKVANTALYVLMQRSVMLGCPLTGQEKDSYLAGFSGSNELDIPLKPGDRSRVSSSSSHLPRKSQHHVRPGSLDITGSSYTRRPRSEVEDSTALQSVSPTKMKVRNGREERRADSASNTKRRSLSESSVNKAAQLELQQQVLDGLQAPSSSSAKVAKLEVKSPKFVSIAPTAFRAPSLSSPMSRSESSSPQPGQAALKTGRISPLLSLVVSTRHTNPIAGQKKSWSSENIAGSDLYSSSGKLRSPGPFSFSLTTPKSNLSAFKFLDKADDTSSILSEQMPDFSVFDKVPTPTEELPPSRNFVFTKQPESQVGKHVEDWGKSKYAFRPIQSGDGDFKEKDTYV